MDVATFRRDGKYSDNRRPDSVEYSSSAEEDVKRRDFTINALLMDEDGKVLDYVGGVNDLKSRTLRTVGNAGERFGEDALRMMRAVRFAVRFRMDIDRAAWLTIQGMKDTIKNISKERVTDELSKMFCHGNADRAYYLLLSSGLWGSFFGKMPDPDDSLRSMYALENVKPEDPFILSLAIMVCEMYQSYREEHLEKLTLTNVQRREVTSLLDRVDPMTNFLCDGVAEQRKMMNWEDRDLIIKFIVYQSKGSRYDWDLPYTTPNRLTTASVYSRMAEIKAMGWPCALVTGDDLIEMGFTPGQVFSKMLNLVRDEQLEGRLLNKTEVKPFLINKFPATPRKLDNGEMFDDTDFRMLISPCPNCGRTMGIEVKKSPEGKYLWDTGRNKVNMRSNDTHLFAISACCRCKRKKENFKEATL